MELLTYALLPLVWLFAQIGMLMEMIGLRDEFFSFFGTIFGWFGLA